MPIRKVKGGYKWGSKGKVYRNRKDAERQAAAAYASGYKKSEDWWDTIKAKKKKARRRKRKSNVNAAGNYTKPGLRKRLFRRIKAGSKGGAPGQWSARKAQMLAREYKAKGGGYRD